MKNISTSQNQSPKIIFVIQAHCSGIYLESLADTIMQDLNRIWDSVQKPEEFRNRTLGDFFDFGFESLTNKLLAPEQYKSQVDLLRRRFVERESTDYVFNRALLPADGLELYMSMIWVRDNVNYNFLSLNGNFDSKQSSSMSVSIFLASMNFLHEPCATGYPSHCWRDTEMRLCLNLPF